MAFTESDNYPLHHLGFPQQTLSHSHHPQPPAVWEGRTIPPQCVIPDCGRILQIVVIPTLEADCIMLEIVKGSNPCIKIHGVLGEIPWRMVS